MSNKKFVMSNKCPRCLKSGPSKPCKLAINRLNGDKKGCDWFINDPQSNYCFWHYLYLHKGEQHSVTIISGLWGSSVNNISIAERSALSKINKIINSNKK